MFCIKRIRRGKKILQNEREFRINEVKKLQKFKNLLLNFFFQLLNNFQQIYLEVHRVWGDKKIPHRSRVKKISSKNQTNLLRIYFCKCEMLMKGSIFSSFFFFPPQILSVAIHYH